MTDILANVGAIDASFAYRSIREREHTRSPRQRSPCTPPAAVTSAALTSFVGRESELALLEPLLSEARLLTLAGPGGIAKTRLALARKP